MDHEVSQWKTMTCMTVHGEEDGVLGLNLLEAVGISEKVATRHVSWVREMWVISSGPSMARGWWCLNSSISFWLHLARSVWGWDGSLGQVVIS